LKEDGPLAQLFSYEITHLVRYWSKNRYNKNYKSNIYLVEEFWQYPNMLFTSPVNISTQTAFLVTLRMCSVYDRLNLEMKFRNSEENIMNETQTLNVENDTDVIFLAEFINFVKFICVKCFNQITQKGLSHANSASQGRQWSHRMRTCHGIWNFSADQGRSYKKEMLANAAVDFVETYIVIMFPMQRKLFVLWPNSIRKSKQNVTDIEMRN
ncbi:hypothetical protein WN51_08144, partial [Melipona quadrifasciata]